MIDLRQHQLESVKNVDILHSQNFKNVMLVLPTGAGKTITMAHYAWRCNQRGEGCVIFAHRDVLLEQISEALCLFNVYHSIYSSNPTVNFISNSNHQKFGNSYYRQSSMIILASVDTFWRRDVSTLLPYIKLWMMDEGHHMTKDSKWHRCIEKLDEQPGTKGLLVTATPLRADRKGLGRHASGIADTMFVGANMHTLIERELLCVYKIYVPESLVDVSDVNVTSSGDYNRDKLAKATDKSNITGSVIDNWKEKAFGKRTIIFTVNIAHSDHVAEQFRAAGVKAVSLSSEDLPAVRKKEIEDFRAGRTTVLVNCDLFSEGFDVPGVEVVIQLRKTMSYAMFKQQFGRMLRILKGKEYGILIDHVGNVPYFMDKYNLQYPHDDPEWSLDDAPKKSKSSGTRTILTITCKKCRAFYSPQPDTDQKDVCPECQHKHSEDEQLATVRSFQEKQGKIIEYELNIDLFKKLLDERKKVDEPPERVRARMKHAGASDIVYNATFNNHAKRRNAQITLRSYIQRWCIKKAKEMPNMPPPIIQREFALMFEIAIIKAMVLSEPEAIKLTERIQNQLGEV